MPQVNASISKRIFVDSNRANSQPDDIDDSCSTNKNDENPSNNCDKNATDIQPIINTGTKDTAYLCHRCRLIFSSRALFEAHYR